MSEEWRSDFMKNTIKIILAVLVCLVLTFCAACGEKDTDSSAKNTAAKTPSAKPTAEATLEATSETTTEPTLETTSEATLDATSEATTEVTSQSTAKPTTQPTVQPTVTPTKEPVANATVEPGKLTYAGGIVSDMPPKEQVMLCDTNGPATHFQIIEDMAIQFFPTTAFTKVSICCPSYSDNNGTLTFSLYSWMGTYEDTMAGKAIKTATFENYRDNELLTLSFDKALPDGEYVLLLSTPDYSDGVGTWCKACSFEGQKIYVDGGGSLPENTELHVELRVSYINTPKNLYGKVSK